MDQAITQADELTAPEFDVSERSFDAPTRRTPLRKRLFDVTIAAPALIIAAPVIGALALASAWTFRAAPVFEQTRLGRGGKVFRFYKIRTLPTIAPDTADKYQLRSLDLPHFSRFVRFRHLDELPQLLLVLSGKMSLVGPRPEMPTLADSFDPRFVRDRLAVQPGCTGLWQVSIRARNLIGEHPEFDQYYLENWTLRLDAWILYRTVLAMATHDEIASVSDVPRWTGAKPR